jgi:hypothetical protein
VTLRIAAGLSLALGIVALTGFFHLLGMGPFASAEERHMRTMKDRREAPSDPAAARLTMFDSLPFRRPLAEYAAVERRGVVVEGYIKHMLRAPDGDYHLEVTATPPTPGRPAAYVTAEITPQWHLGAKHWGFESLRTEFRSASGGDATLWSEPARRVRLTGWLLYDFEFDTRRPDLTRVPFEQRVSGWELHPVTRIEVGDEALAAFAEVPR